MHSVSWAFWATITTTSIGSGHQTHWLRSGCMVHFGRLVGRRWHIAGGSNTGLGRRCGGSNTTGLGWATSNTGLGRRCGGSNTGLGRRCGGSNTGWATSNTGLGRRCGGSNTGLGWATSSCSVFLWGGTSDSW
jgi:hypothetical protein